MIKSFLSGLSLSEKSNVIAPFEVYPVWVVVAPFILTRIGEALSSSITDKLLNIPTFPNTELDDNIWGSSPV